MLVRGSLRLLLTGSLLFARELPDLWQQAPGEQLHRGAETAMSGTPHFPRATPDASSWVESLWTGFGASATSTPNSEQMGSRPRMKVYTRAL